MVFRITQNQVISSGGEVISYLNITSARVEDGGEYTCLSKNKAGQAAHSSRLNVYGKPLRLKSSTNRMVDGGGRHQTQEPLGSLKPAVGHFKFKLWCLLDKLRGLN